MYGYAGDLSRTFVLVDDDGQVAGYYSLTMGGVRREALPAYTAFRFRPVASDSGGRMYLRINEALEALDIGPA